MPQSRRTIPGIRIPASLTGILGITACCASGSHNALTVLMDVFFCRNGKAEGTRRRNTGACTRIDRPGKKAKLYRHRITSVGETTQMYGRAAAPHCSSRCVSHRDPLLTIAGDLDIHRIRLDRAAIGKIRIPRCTTPIHNNGDGRRCIRTTLHNGRINIVVARCLFARTGTRTVGICMRVVKGYGVTRGGSGGCCFPSRKPKR